MVDSYYISRNLEVNILEYFFSIMELHKSRLVGLKEIRTLNYNIALAMEPKKTDLDSLMDGNHAAYLVRKMKKLLNSNKFDRKQTNKLLYKKKKFRCFDYDEKRATSRRIALN